MIYILTALKPEAQAFVDFYKLSKSKLGSYTLFFNADIKLIISGLGVVNAREATQTLINYYDITDDDVYLNIGICGANQDYKIGELIHIGSIIYDLQTYSFGTSNKTLVCKDTEVTTSQYDIVDMESYGFYDAVIHSPAIKNFHILKVVSDHFQPQLVTKEKTKALLFNVINNINTIIQN
jgi:purine-nucleoside phosphorylase